MIDKLTDPLLSLLYPQQCRVCAGPVHHRADGVSCDGCWAHTRIFDGSEMRCDKCGLLMGDTAAPVAVRCHKCDEHHYDRAYTIGVYEKGLATNILELKKTPQLPSRLWQLIRSATLPDADLIIPAPLSKSRRLERGFNQAELIAEAISRSTRIPLDTHSLERRLPTHVHRVGMDDKARELSVRNVFSVSRPKLINARRVLFVDDVFTSGATASGCAKVLKKSGATEVNVFTLARAVWRSS
ncbi:MAG: ComF family protein [Pyrinomonadaceae bacterium]